MARGCKKKDTRNECKAYKMSGRKEINKEKKRIRHEKRMEKQAEKIANREWKKAEEELRIFNVVLDRDY